MRTINSLNDTLALIRVLEAAIKELLGAAEVQIIVSLDEEQLTDESLLPKPEGPRNRGQT